MLTATQTKSIKTTLTAVNQSFQLMVFAAKFWNRRVILPTIDYLYGNACAWEEWYKHNPFAQELKSVIAAVFISLPFLLGTLFREWCENLVNQSLSAEGRAIALGYTEEQLDAFKKAVSHVNQSIETVATDTIEASEPVVNQSVETDYNGMGIRRLRKIAANANMPGARNARKADIIAFLARA